MLICLLLLKWGGLSLTSLSLTVTVVVPDNPPRWPPMSLAWRTTRYSSWVSLSMSGTAVRKMPGGERRAGHAATKSKQQQISQWHRASLNYHQRESDAHILELGRCTHVTSGHFCFWIDHRRCRNTQMFLSILDIRWKGIRRTIYTVRAVPGLAMCSVNISRRVRLWNSF